VIVVADTSVLLNLCRIGQVELLARLFHEVVIPLEVAAEFERLALLRAGLARLGSATTGGRPSRASPAGLRPS
jgi:predicted nucleic acid-binding protein